MTSCPLAHHPHPDCDHCGQPAAFPDMVHPACNNCWEVLRRLGEFLRSAKNRAHVKSLVTQ